jgi:hypothetical protein
MTKVPVVFDYTDIEKRLSALERKGDPPKDTLYEEDILDDFIEKKPKTKRPKIAKRTSKTHVLAMIDVQISMSSGMPVSKECWEYIKKIVNNALDD